MTNVIDQPAEKHEIGAADKIIADLVAERDALIFRIDWIESHREAFNKLPFALSFSKIFGSIDFDNLSHDDVVKVIKMFGGKWDKQPSFGSAVRIDYTSEIDGMKLRCWQGEPPPLCKVVEMEEEVPAQPASKRIVKKLVCQEAQTA